MGGFDAARAAQAHIAARRSTSILCQTLELRHRKWETTQLTGDCSHAHNRPVALGGSK